MREAERERERKRENEERERGGGEDAIAFEHPEVINWNNLIGDERI